jgi:CheY-like chemotaxis protein
MDLKVLLVEDDPASERLICALIRNVAREVIRVNNGKAAIEACEANPDIDLILMDIGIPGMNGFETTRMIRGFNPEVVIIAQTAFALDGDREKTLEAGCTDYISKPINKSSLFALLNKYFD